MEEAVGVKPSNNYQSNRPESGGADRDDLRQKSGLLEKDKEKFAADRAAERQNETPSSAPGEHDRDSGKGSGESRASRN